MFDLIRAQPLKALWALGLPALTITAYLLIVMVYSLNYNDGATGALLDDTWIHVRFADSISDGRGLMYNPGVVTSGATSPLWVLTLGGVFALTDPGIYQQVEIAVLMSAIGAVLAVVVTSGFAWYVVRRAWVGLLAGMIVALTGRMIWMGLSGMEITTFTALCVLALWSHVADVRDGRTFGWRTGIITALATLARPEGYLLAVVIGGTAFILIPLLEQRDGQARAWLNRVRNGWRGIFAYVLLAGSYPLVCLLIDGYPLPNTFRVKSRLGEEAPNLLYGYFWTPRIDHGWLLIALAVLGAAWLLRSAYQKRGDLSYAVVLWPVAFVVGVLYLGPQHFVVNNSRYVAPAIPFHALLAAVGVCVLAGFLRTRWPKVATVAPAIFGVLLLAMAFWQGRGQGHLVANDVFQLRQMHVSAGEWLATITDTGDIIALNDVGAIAHITDLQVLDMVGLVSPELIEPISNAPRFTCPHDLEIARVMLDQQPRFVAVFPWFFPCLTDTGGNGFPDILQPFNVFTITGPTVIAGGELVVYWPVWDRWPIQAAVPVTAAALDVDFEGGVGLRGQDVAITPDGVRVDLWWTATTRPADDLTVFVHIIDAMGEIVAQSDSRPRDGRMQTTWWRSGDIVPDSRFIPLSADALEAAVAVRVGLYPTGGGARLLRITAPPEELDFVIIPLATD